MSVPLVSFHNGANHLQLTRINLLLRWREEIDIYSKYSCCTLGAMVTCLEPHWKRGRPQGFRRKRLLGEKLIIQSQWKWDTSAHMVQRWTNQLNINAQMEVMSLLPTTTGSPSLNKGNLQYQVKHFFYNPNLQSVLYEMFCWQFFFCRGMLIS